MTKTNEARVWCEVCGIVTQYYIDDVCPREVCFMKDDERLAKPDMQRGAIPTGNGRGSTPRAIGSDAVRFRSMSKPDAPGGFANLIDVSMMRDTRAASGTLGFY